MTGPPPTPGRFGAGVSALNPGYFALVMATGIVSVDARILAWEVVSVALLAIAAAAYLALIVLNVVRVGRFWNNVAADFEHPARGFGYFTFVAATCVLGSRLAAVPGMRPVAVTLLVVGALSAAVLGYTLPWTVMRRERMADQLKHANGSWFVWSVAVQSVAVLAATLQVASPSAWKPLITLVAVFCWAVGIFLYAAVGVMVMIRLLAHTVHPRDLTAPYWVAMGATAIGVVAGARIAQMSDAPTVDATRAVIAGLAVFFWSFGTWLVPMLLMAGWWRHVLHKVPLRYEVALWDIVFPLGMYSAGSQLLGSTDLLPLVHGVGTVEAGVALAAWLAVFIAMLVSVGHPRRR